MQKIVSSLVLISFFLNGVMPPAVAEVVFMPPAQGTVSLSAAFTPCQLRGVKIDPQDPFHLDFIVEEGDSGLTGQAFEDESQKLIKYFLATLTTPENDLWVNLSPYEDNRIIQDDFGRTAMGRDLLAQDYVLKQITASLMHPDADLGKKFWDEVYKRTYAKYGTTDIPVDTFNKVWIVPERAVIYESSNHSMSAYVDETRLKVMLESDYLAAQEGTGHQALGTGRMPETIGPTSSAQWPVPSAKVDTQDLAKQVVRDVIVPVLEREVNEGRNFAELRQVYHSLLLAVWLKKKLQSAVPPEPVTEKPGIMKGNLLSMIFVNQHKTGGLETADPQAEVRSIYDRYFEAFKKGAYNIIREDYDIYSQELIPRKYFSGGLTFGDVDKAIEIRAGRPKAVGNGLKAVRTQLDFAQKSQDQNRPVRVVIKKEAVKTALVLMVTSSIAISTFVGYFIHRQFNRGTEGLVTAPLRGALVVEPDRPLDVQAVGSILDEVTKTLRSYQTGDLHRKKGVSEKLFTPEITVDEFLERLSAPGDEVQLDAGRLANMLNEVIRDYGAPLKALGLTTSDVSRLLLHLIAKESEGYMGKSQMVGRKRNIIQARGGSQFEYETFRAVLEAAADVLSRDSFQGPANFKDFRGRVQNEMKRKLGSVKYNRWLSKNPKDMVVLSRDHFALMVIWLSHLAETQPLPLEVEFSRLDAQYLGENGAGSSWENPEPPLIRVMQRLRTTGTFRSQDLKTLTMVSLAASWNGGNNVSAGLREYWLNFLLSDRSKRLQLVKQAGQEAYAAYIGKEQAKGKVKRVLGKKNIDALFSENPRIREKMLKTVRGYLKGRLIAEKEAFRKAWGEYRDAEKKFKETIWKVRNAPQVADVYYLLGALRKNGYTIGLTLRSDLDRYDEIFNGVLSAIDSYEPGKQFKTLDFAQGGVDEKQFMAVDNAASYGGIDLQTGQMDLDIRGNAGSFEIEIPKDTLERLRNDVTGFVPLIINVQPVSDVPLFLGLAEKENSAS